MQSVMMEVVVMAGDSHEAANHEFVVADDERWHWLIAKEEELYHKLLSKEAERNPLMEIYD